MSRKHTPGPWFWAGHPGKSNLHSVERGCVMEWGEYDNLWFSGYEFTKDAGEVHEIDKANARLIAAAPEMLKALHQALAVINGVMNEFGTAPAWELAAQEISAAIAKAEGQS